VSLGTLGKDAVSVTRRRNGCFSLPSAVWHSANLFTDCPRKSIRQRRLCRCTVCRAFFAEYDTRQSLYRMSAKPAIPAVNTAIYHIFAGLSWMEWTGTKQLPRCSGRVTCLILTVRSEAGTTRPTYIYGCRRSGPARVRRRTDLKPHGACSACPAVCLSVSVRR
jgi:hypothetical protein